jgi:hypothetical protein
MTGPIIAIVIGVCLLFIASFQWLRGNTSRRFARSKQRVIRPQQSQLEQKLLKLCGNRKMVDRLIRQSQLRHPDKTPNWHWEKAIYDLERDRWR